MLGGRPAAEWNARKAMESQLWLEYLGARREPLTEAGAALHRRLCETSPRPYLALLADPAAVISHQREVLANLLRVPAARTIPRAHLRELLDQLPTERVLQILDILPARRINGQRAHK